jgi:Glu-tRNA(Gln) amidotransferase subunit E-like FAD-binding protein
LPEYPWDREKRYREMGVPDDCITPLSQSKWAALFERVVKALRIDATFAAVVLCQRFKAFRRAGLAIEELSEDQVYEVFKAYADGKLAREGVRVVLRHFLVRDPQSESKAIPEVLEALGLTPVPADRVHGLVTDATEGLDENGFPTTGHKHRFVMGNLMGTLLGRCAGTTLAKELDAEIGAD